MSDASRTSEPLNPYASPVFPTEEANVQFDELGLVATFTMEEADQLASVEVIPAPVSRWLLLGGGIGILVSVAAVVYAFQMYPPDDVIAFSSLSLLLGLVLLFFGQGASTWWFRQTALQKLRAHPLLGILGPWQLIVTSDRLIVENSAGSQAFARRRTEIWNTEHQLVIWFGGQPIVIPSREPYAAMCREVRHRLWQLAQQDQRKE